MKKLLTKLRRKSTETSSRITNETVAEHRERILAGGRRFKYPIQYARHRLVINAIIISVAAIAILIVVGWWQLYSAQNTSVFMYRVTKVLPVPVASIDGQPVLYSDYLMKYLSSVHYLEQKEQVSLKSEDGKRQIEYIKQQAMADAIDDAYATKLAKQLGIMVSDVELESFLKLQRQLADGEISQQTYDATALDYYGWTPDEYRYAIKAKLLRQKVAYAIDDTASAATTLLGTQLKTADSNLQTIAATMNAAGGTQVVYGAPGKVPRSNQDGGLAVLASKLRIGQISDAIKSTTGDGYYFVRLLEVNELQVSYEYIQIPLTEFAKRLEAIDKAGKISEYISIPEPATTQ